MTPTSYTCPLPGGASAEEYVLACDRGRAMRVLVVPALFDEGHKLRHLTVEVMRRLDGAGIDCFLPDLPGPNESLADLAGIALEDWQGAIAVAVRDLGATHLLALRGGGLLLPAGLPGWHYGPVKGASLLRTLMRARVLSAREAGREESADQLAAEAAERGIDLAGYPVSADMFAQLMQAAPAPQPAIRVIEPDLIGGTPLWLRAEPDHDPAQADALAAVIAMEVRT